MALQLPDGVTIDDYNDYKIIEIRDLSNELKEKIKNELTVICHGEYALSSALNEDLASIGYEGCLVFTLIGGGALVINIPDVRVTADLDVISSYNNLPTQIVDLINMNGIQIVDGVAEVPEINEIEFVDSFEFDHVVVRVADLYGLAVNKFYSRRQKDLDDLERHICPNIVNWDKLKEDIDSYKYEVVGTENPDMNIYQFDRLRQKYEKK